jgi:diaminopimelate epimerase
VEFWKMAGAGNDFVVLKARSLPEGGLGPLAAAALCDRRQGIGADGVLVVEAGDHGEVRVDYRNADGSPARFCGNGARCAAHFAAAQGIAGTSMVLRFAGSRIPARVDGDEVSIDVPRPEVLATRRVELSGGRGALAVSTVRAGVDHLVVDESKEPRLPLEQVAVAAGRSPGEINLTAYRFEQDGTLHARTVERGSGETLACGSAALAVAALASRGRSVVVVPPAGIPLTVHTPPRPQRFTLVAEARLVFHGTYLLSAAHADR